jgi:hypothetical protein
MSNASTPAHKQGQITPMVIAGGNKNSVTGVSERQDGSAPVFDPLRWSQEDVDPNDLWFSGLSSLPTAFGQNSFMAPPDPGTIVYVLKQMGEPGGIILGMSNTVRNGGDGGGAGGTDIMNGSFMQQLKNEKVPVSIPPKLKETTERGAKIRKIEEKGEEHSLGLLDGLPIHGALFQMTGFKLPEIKNVPTAKQKNDKMMNNQMMQQLPGQIMSMAQMFQGLMSKGGSGGAGAGNQTYMQQINNKVPPHVQTAVKSLSKLVQGLDAEGGVEFVTGGVVHEDTYLENSANLLSQCTSVHDIMSCMQRLQWDTSLFGHDKLNSVEYTIDTAHGPAKQIVDFDGTVQVVYDANTMNNMNNWANVVSSNTYSPGVGSAPPSSPSSGSNAGGGQGSMMNNMFGQSSKIMQEMFKRLAPQQEKEAKKMHEKLNRSGTANKLQNIAKDTIEGGEPLSKEHYKSDGSSVGSGQFSLQFLE